MDTGYQGIYGVEDNSISADNNSPSKKQPMYLKM